MGRVLAILYERKHVLTLRSQYLIPRHLLKINEHVVYRKTCTRTFTASFILTPSWNQHLSPSMRLERMTTDDLETKVYEAHLRESGYGTLKGRRDEQTDYFAIFVFVR